MLHDVHGIYSTNIPPFIHMHALVSVTALALLIYSFIMHVYIYTWLLLMYVVYESYYYYEMFPFFEKKIARRTHMKCIFFLRFTVSHNIGILFTRVIFL